MKILTMRPALPSIAALTLALGVLPTPASAADAQLKIHRESDKTFLQVFGDGDDEWRFENSSNLSTWAPSPSLGTAFSDPSAPPALTTPTPASGNQFFRSVKTSGLYDPNVIRTFRLTFTNSNWAATLTSGRTTGSNTPVHVTLDNGLAIPGAGARYKGNTSFNGAGEKKSINLQTDFIDPNSKLLGYDILNFNNGAGDETILREPLYFNVMNEYAPSPKGGLAKLYINEEFWGLYSLAQQEDADLIQEWFPSKSGDRWRAPNAGGIAGGAGGTPPGGGAGGTPPGGGGMPPGGGGTPPGGGAGGGAFASAASALSYLGASVTNYTANYELKTDNSTNAWERLVHVIDVLNNTPADTFPAEIQKVLAVDRWLWFLAVENIFADDDSYFNKGADYGFYFEPESGRIHPVEHDGNESFTAGDVQLSPVQGSAGTNRPVLLKLLGVPEYRQRYLAHMRTVLDEKFNPPHLHALIDRMSAMSIEALIADPKKNFTMTAYTNDLNALKSFITQRYSYLKSHPELTPLPPAIVDVSQPSPAPTPGVSPLIHATVKPASGSGIDSVWLRYRTLSYGPFTAVRMHDDGSNGDPQASDSIFTASLPKQPVGTRVHYYVEARSSNEAKAASFHPARAEQVTLSYRVALAESTPSALVLNEFLADNSRFNADPQGQFDDWIELHNTSASEIDLTGMYLSDNANNPRKWRFPDGARIPPNGYVLVWADEDTADSGLHANFKLSTDGEEILLVDSDERLNALLDWVKFGAQTENRSYARPLADPDHFEAMTPTPGQPNR